MSLSASRALGGDERRGVRVYETLAELSDAAAQLIEGAARDAVAKRGRFVVALAGGETPKPLYQLLARDYRDTISWDRVEVCFGDERCVPPHNPASNFRLAWTALLEHVPIVEKRVHRMLAELGPDAAAREYDGQLGRLFGGDEGATFDVAILGVGTDGHTASLFPGDAAVDEVKRRAAPAHAPVGAKVRERVTVTLPVFNRARVVLFLCAGEEKRQIVARVLSGAADELPAARVLGMEETLWLLDRAAAP